MSVNESPKPRCQSKCQFTFVEWTILMLNNFFYFVKIDDLIRAITIPTFPTLGYNTLMLSNVNGNLKSSLFSNDTLWHSRGSSLWCVIKEMTWLVPVGSHPTQVWKGWKSHQIRSHVLNKALDTAQALWINIQSKYHDVFHMAPRILH